MYPVLDFIQGLGKRELTEQVCRGRINNSKSWFIRVSPLFAAKASNGFFQVANRRRAEASLGDRDLL